MTRIHILGDHFIFTAQSEHQSGAEPKILKNLEKLKEFEETWEFEEALNWEVVENSTKRWWVSFPLM